MCWINLFGNPCNLDDRNIYDLTPIFGKKTVVSCRFCLIDPAAFYSAELYSYSKCKSLSITLPVNRLNPLWSQLSTQEKKKESKERKKEKEERKERKRKKERERKKERKKKRKKRKEEKRKNAKEARKKKNLARA